MRDDARYKSELGADQVDVSVRRPWRTIVTGTDRRSEPSLWLLGAILLLAAVLRLYALGREGLWCDEAYTALTIRLPLGEMITRLVRTDDAPPLFYVLQKLNATLLGDSEAALRTGSALAGILAVAILLWWSHRRDARAGGWSAAFLAVAAYGVFHSRQARSYALMILLAMGLVLSARDLLSGRQRAGPILAICAALLCLTHNVAIVLVLSSLVLWPLGGPARPRLRTWLLWHALPLAVWTIYWLATRTQLAAHGVLNAWTAHYWQSHSLVLAPFYSLGAYLPGGLPASAFGSGFAMAQHLSPLWTLLSAALGAVCVLIAFLRARGPDAACPEAERREVAVEAAFLFLPLAALVVASLVIQPVYVLTRTDVLAFPAFVLLIGRGLAHLPRRAAAGILFFWFVLSLLSLAPTYGLGDPGAAKNNDRRLAHEMAADGLAPGDWVVHTFMTAPSIEYYLERLGAAHHTAWFPRVAESNIASAWRTPLDSLPAYQVQAGELRSRMEAALPADGTVWIFAVVEPSSAEAVRQQGATGTLTVEQLGYPTSVLVHSLVGAQPVRPAGVYTQDWVAGLRVLLRIPRGSWVPADAGRSP